MELISVNALLEQAQCTNAYFQVKSIVAGLPKIDAEPVVHGHWNVERDNGSIMFTCSCCGYGYADIDSVFIDEPHKYCPECGAKMDEEQ